MITLVKSYLDQKILQIAPLKVFLMLLDSHRQCGLLNIDDNNSHDPTLPAPFVPF